MNVSRAFIQRPVATILLMVGVLLAGLIGYRALPISALPEVDYPTMQVYTEYPGAGPDVTADTITAPLERQLGQIAGLDKMRSSSANGASVITLQFGLSTSMDEVEQEVQAAINAAKARLPDDLPYPPVYSKVNPADTAVLTLAMHSSLLPLTDVRELAETRVSQKISQMSGVGLVTVSGGQRPAVRVTVDTRALASHGLTLAAVDSALAAANVNMPKGTIDGATVSYAIGANDQLVDPAQYAALVLSWKDGAPLFLRDVATIGTGAEDARQAALSGDTPSILISIQRQPGANVIETVDGVLDALPALSSSLPASVDMQVLSDRTDTIRASVHDVQVELAIAIALVVAVIWMFLRNWPATLIPGIAVPLSLVGTVAVIYALGFSLNNLTLMALTVATGFLVDDAIVMIENISRHMESGKSRMQAALDGAGQVGFTIVSLSLALIAVMIPLLFMGDVVGRLFREFAVTLSVAIVVSAGVTLTLVPMLSARMLQPAAGHSRSERLFERIERGYAHLLQRLMQRRLAVMVVVLIATGLTALTLVALPKGLFPVQDTGMLQGALQVDAQASFARIQQRQQSVAKLIAADPAVESVSVTVGVGQTNTALGTVPMLIRLKPDGDGSTAVAARLGGKAREAGMVLNLRPVQDLTLDSQSSAMPYAMGLEATDRKLLGEWTPRLMAAMKADPMFAAVDSQASRQGLQARLDVDRVMASRLGVSMQAIDAELYAAFGQSQVSTIYTDLSQYQVVLAATGGITDVRDALQRVHVAGRDGTPVQLSTLATVSVMPSPVTLERQGQFPYADIGFDLQPGIALGDALPRLKQLGDEIGMPPSITPHLEGTAGSFDGAMSGQAILMIAAVLVVYLVLGMLYESFIHPLTILSTLPSAVLGALSALLLAGLQFDVIGTIGVVLLVGMVMKNAIMMIDFALELEREHGLSAEQAIQRACEQRFRPILMTTLAALLGAFPLAFGGGMGAELRQPLGLAIIGGLVVSQLLTLFSTPVIYLLLHPAERALARRI
ncbi:multidrug efflux pump [Pseudoxanthomonas sp. GM95]|uniref:efflux RND transporter permease subunit n=1 Tax=Pseudoxanthomonas sp. GM95 TaxID=1881043 RepID=UPI0008B9029F|nr:efflux RND transporter permease subunit [Pseudoxanthomonas sp. GM95]SEL08532.1 multidrug efflux pump [Pseudoxanthomonas sp. GM95]